MTESDSRPLGVIEMVSLTSAGIIAAAVAYNYYYFANINIFLIRALTVGDLSGSAIARLPELILNYLAVILIVILLIRFVGIAFNSLRRGVVGSRGRIRAAVASALSLNGSWQGDEFVLSPTSGIYARTAASAFSLFGWVINFVFITVVLLVIWYLVVPLCGAIWIFLLSMPIENFLMRAILFMGTSVLLIVLVPILAATIDLLSLAVVGDDPHVLERIANNTYNVLIYFLIFVLILPFMLASAQVRMDFKRSSAESAACAALDNATLIESDCVLGVIDRGTLFVDVRSREIRLLLRESEHNIRYCARRMEMNRWNEVEYFDFADRQVRRFVRQTPIGRLFAIKEQTERLPATDNCNWSA